MTKIPSRSFTIATSAKPNEYGVMVNTVVITNRTRNQFWLKSTIGEFLACDILSTSSSKIADQWIADLAA